MTLLFLEVHRETDLFFHLQEFNSHNQPFTIVVWCSPHRSSLRSVKSSSNLLSLNLVSIFRCSSPPHNPVYVSRVDPSVLGFSLSLHRHYQIHCVSYFYRDIFCPDSHSFFFISCVIKSTSRFLLYNKNFELWIICLRGTHDGCTCLNLTNFRIHHSKFS